MISENAINFAIKKGWNKAGSEFNFAKVYSNKFMNWASACYTRQKTSLEKGGINKGNMEVLDAMNILKSHHNLDFQPSKSTTKDLCMHATGILSTSHTVSSIVVEIREKVMPTIWITGSSNPCLSLFKPVYLGGNFNFSISKAKPNDSFWWKVEQFNRLALKNYSQIKSLTEKAFITFQNELIEQDEKLIYELAHQKFPNLEINSKFEQLTNEALDFHEKFILKNSKRTLEKKNTFAPFFNNFWAKQNKVFAKT